MRFSGFDDEWKSYRIGDISKTYSGGTPSTSKKVYYYGNIPFIKSGEINKSCTEQYINEDAINNSSAKKVKKGDLLLALYGATSGEVAISKIDGAINQAVLKIDNNMDNYFQYNYFLKYKEKIIHKYLQGGQGNLSSNIIKKLEFKFPKMEEQQKISRFLLLIDEKIQLLKKKHKEYQNFKKYLMQQIFTQKLRFDFDGEWKNIPFKKLLKEINEKTTVNNQHEILSSTKEGIFTQKEYFANRNVASKDNTGYKILRKNQIVLSPQNLWMGNINVNTEFDIGIVSPSYKIYETTDLVDINYFKHIIKLPRLIYEYTCASEQGASIVRRNLNKELFNEITIKVPSSNEQEKIGKMFDAYDEKIKNIDKNIQDIKEFKKGLIQQMFIVRINWRCNFKLVKSPSFNKHLLILKNKIIFIIIK